MRSLVIVCLLAVTLAATVTPKRTVLNVFAEVEATIKNGSPLEGVANILGEFTNDATAEQSAHDALRERATAECAGEFAYRSVQVSEASSALKQGQTLLDSCNDQKNRANADLTFTNKVIGETESMLEILHGAREAEIAAFEEYEEAYNFNAAQMDEVVELVEAVVTGEASMIQITRHTQKMIASAIKIDSVEKMSTLFSMLVQMTTGEADNEFFEQLSNVVQRLRDEIESEFNTESEQEAANAQEYETLTAEATAQLETLHATQANLETNIAQLNKCIIEQSGIVASQTARRNQHQRLWDEAAAYCATGEELYVQSTQERRDQLDLLDNLRSKVTERWGDFEDVERERVEKERAKKD